MLTEDTDTGYAVRVANLAFAEARMVAGHPGALALRALRLRKLTTYRATALVRAAAARLLPTLGRLAVGPERLLRVLTVRPSTDAPVLTLTSPRGPTALPSTVIGRVAATA